MKIKSFLIALAVAAGFSACSVPQNINYFQDMPSEMSMNVQNPLEIKIRPDDRISILVSTRDQELSQLFSLYSNANSGSGEMRKGSEYTVDSNGTIHFPVLGRLHVAGMNREEIAAAIRDELVARNLVKDPIITVNFSNLHVTVLGDVASAGEVLIDRDKFTLIDAIAKCGDLQITGRRQNVKVIRQSNGRETAYEVDLCSAKDLLASPVYYLQQNDIIYVESNDKKSRTAVDNGSAMATPAFWISLFTFAVSVVTLMK